MLAEGLQSSQSSGGETGSLALPYQHWKEFKEERVSSLRAFWPIFSFHCRFKLCVVQEEKRGMNLLQPPPCIQLLLKKICFFSRLGVTLGSVPTGS